MKHTLIPFFLILGCADSAAIKPNEFDLISSIKRRRRKEGHRLRPPIPPPLPTPTSSIFSSIVVNNPCEGKLPTVEEVITTFEELEKLHPTCKDQEEYRKSISLRIDDAVFIIQSCLELALQERVSKLERAWKFEGLKDWDTIENFNSAYLTDIAMIDLDRRIDEFKTAAGREHPFVDFGNLIFKEAITEVVTALRMYWIEPIAEVWNEAHIRVGVILSKKFREYCAQQMHTSTKKYHAAFSLAVLTSLREHILEFEEEADAALAVRLVNERIDRLYIHLDNAIERKSHYLRVPN